jgi:integrase
VKKATQRLAERTGIPFSPHVLRHTCAVWAVQDGASIAEIAQFLGHTSSRVTETVYARYSPSYLRKVSDSTEF